MCLEGIRSCLRLANGLPSKNLRAITVKLLLPVFANQLHFSNAHPVLLDLPPKDKSFCINLAFSVLRFAPRLEFFIRQLLKTPLKSKDLDLKVLLYVGLCELTVLHHPEHSSVSETVAASQILRKPWASKLVNGLLREFIRNDSLQQQAINNLSAQYAHPSWLIGVIKKSWPNDWQKILEQNNLPGPMSLRVNQKQYQREQYLKLLNDNGINAVVCTYNSHGISLTSPQDVHNLPGFASGAVSVQDNAAQLAANLLDLKPGLRILDACAAPGGKLAHILESQPDCELVALESNKNRVIKLKETLKRLIDW